MTHESSEETRARLNIHCVCGNLKDALGGVVCWNCFKHRTDVIPLKYANLSYVEWVKTLPKRDDELQRPD